MSLFVKSKTIEIEKTKIVISEIGVQYMLLSDEEKQDSVKILEMHTSLTDSEVKNLTIEAFNNILEEFYKLNEIHFSSKDDGESGGK